MHELGIATEIYRVSRRAGDERGAGALERVKVAVGELSAVEPDLLRFAWEAVVRDGPDDGALAVGEPSLPVVVPPTPKTTAGARVPRGDLVARDGRRRFGVRGGVAHQGISGFGLRGSGGSASG